MRVESGNKRSVVVGAVGGSVGGSVGGAVGGGVGVGIGDLVGDLVGGGVGVFGSASTCEEEESEVEVVEDKSEV